MKKIAVLWILFWVVMVVFGQVTSLPNDISCEKKYLPEKIQTIQQYTGDLLMNVKEFDLSKNMTFSHHKQYVGENWNGKYLTMITGKVYNDKGREEKTYHLHSNVGLTIWYYEYDSNGNNTRVYSKAGEGNKHDSLINQNPYRYIEEIVDFKGLINHPRIMELEKKDVMYLLWDRTYDSAGNKLTELMLNEKKDTIMFVRNEYDERNNPVCTTYQLPDGLNWAYYFEHEKEVPFMTDVISSESAPDKLLQSVRVDFDRRENRKRISEIELSEYDDKDRLIERISFNHGKFNNRYIIEYNESGQISKKIAYFYDADKVAFTNTYMYNQEGNIIKVTNEDFRSGKKEDSDFRYAYEYYP